MKYIKVLILALALLVGCSKAPETPGKGEIDANGARDFVETNSIEGMFNTMIVDQRYILPTRAWVTEVFSCEFYDFLSKNKSLNWVEEANDCDNFAGMARFYALMMHHRDSGLKTGLAFGEFYYRRDGSKWNDFHAINFFLTKDGDDVEVVFYEPQFQKIITLTKSEIASVVSLDM